MAFWHYADDITLLRPSIRELIEMIVLCCEYANDYNIAFNPKKTVYIKVGSNIYFDEHVSINEFPVQWSESVRHIGNLTLLNLHCLTHWIADTNDPCLLDMLINV